MAIVHKGAAPKEPAFAEGSTFGEPLFAKSATPEEPAFAEGSTLGESLFAKSATLEEPRFRRRREAYFRLSGFGIKFRKAWNLALYRFLSSLK